MAAHRDMGIQVVEVYQCDAVCMLSMPSNPSILHKHFSTSQTKRFKQMCIATPLAHNVNIVIIYQE